jgi:hypothetical protein
MNAVEEGQGEQEEHCRALSHDNGGGASVVPLSMQHPGSDNAHHHGITAEMSQMTAMKMRHPGTMPIGMKGFKWTTYARFGCNVALT